MSDETDALNALKTILAGIDPSPEPSPVNIWVLPDDEERINIVQFPVMIVRQATNRSITVQRYTSGMGKHRWPIEVLLLLANDPQADRKQWAAAERKRYPWRGAMEILLAGNQKLNNTVQSIGGEAPDHFMYRVGKLNNPFLIKPYWGIRFEILVTQYTSLTVSA